MDSNHRPHAYQACALNQLSYRPIPKIYLVEAGNENRTRDNSLEGCGFTTKLYPHDKQMARDGIEPPTHGASIRCSTN